MEQYDPSQPEKYLKGVLQDNHEQNIVDAFSSYIGVIPSASIGFDHFATQVIMIISITSITMANHAEMCMIIKVNTLQAHQT